MNLELLTRAIERVMATKYGKTVTVRVENVTSVCEKETSKCPRTD